MTPLMDPIKPCAPSRGLWLLSSALLLPSYPLAVYAESTVAVTDPIVTPKMGSVDAVVLAPPSDIPPLTIAPANSFQASRESTDYAQSSAPIAEDQGDLIDLTFPDLEASLPPLEFIDPEPVPSAPSVEATAPKRGVLGRLRHWILGGEEDDFAAEPVIEASIDFVTELPQTNRLELMQWADDQRIEVEPRPLDPALPALTSEQQAAALALLADNLSASLERVTVEEFTEFNDSLPRLRSLARAAAQAVGFYDSQFFFRKTAADQLAVDVVAGTPVRVVSQRIDIDGEAQDQRRFQRIESQPDLAVGDVLNHAKYEQTKNRIASAALERGYFDGRWQAHDVQVTLPDHIAEIQLVYQSGERYRFGDITFSTPIEEMPLPVRRELLQALVPFETGKYYNARQVQTLSRQLLDTRWFNNIEVTAFTPDTIKNQQISPATPLPATPPVAGLPLVKTPAKAPESKVDAVTDVATEASQAKASAVTETETETELLQASRAKIVPVRVLVDARQPNSAEAGIGYGTDTGVRFRSQYRRALLNDRGHSLDANLELSQIRQAIDTRYSLPYKHPLKDTLSLFGGFEREETEQIDAGFNIESVGVTLGVERSIRPSPDDWQRTLSLRYRVDQVDVQFSDLASARSVYPAASSNVINLTQQVLLAGYAFNKVTSRGGIDPYQGRRYLYQVEVGSQALLSDVNLAILRAGWRAIESFPEKHQHQLVGRVDLASILTDDFSSVPYNLRFFAGGDQSIRGYDYKSLSTLRDGELSGGQNLAVASLEYNYRFLPAWRGAVFVDAGNAFDEKFSDDVKVGVGLGVRWSSPIGPIRVDVAAGVSESSLPIRLHFFIGPSL